ncbi:TPA: hypothetical protein ACH3X3_005332 [Trebouxia sp. C0006]
MTAVIALDTAVVQCIFWFPSLSRVMCSSAGGFWSLVGLLILTVFPGWTVVYPWCRGSGWLQPSQIVCVCSLLLGCLGCQEACPKGIYEVNMLPPCTDEHHSPVYVVPKCNGRAWAIWRESIPHGLRNISA